MASVRGENEMAYAVVTALIFALVAIAHGGMEANLYGPSLVNPVAMTVSWVALVVSALLAIWGFSDLGLYALKRFGALRS